MANAFTLDRADKAVMERIADIIPDRVFDAHAHPFIRSELDLASTPILGELPENGDIGYWESTSAAIFGEGRAIGGLFFGLPVLPKDNMPERIRRANDFVLGELKAHGGIKGRALLLVAHSSDPAQVEAAVKADRAIAGFKPYAALNPECGPSPEIHEYLPRWACELADKYGLAVTLHILRPKALDDDGNVSEINALLKNYPNMQLILAHAGAGFNMYNTIYGCERLSLAENLWFDLSAVCDPPAITAVLRRFGHSRVMWGSDYPISLRKGRITTLGTMIISLQKDTIREERLSPLCELNSIALENLRAVAHSLRETGMSASAVEDIFAGNAISLLDARR